MGFCSVNARMNSRLGLGQIGACQHCDTTSNHSCKILKPRNGICAICTEVRFQLFLPEDRSLRPESLSLPNSWNLVKRD